MKREEMEEVIEKYTDEDFAIKGFEVDETTVSIRFVDTKKAEDFVCTVNDIICEMPNNFIKWTRIVRPCINDTSFTFRTVSSLSVYLWWKAKLKILQGVGGFPSAIYQIAIATAIHCVSHI